MQTERVTYLTSVEQKAALEAFAKARGESVGNVVRDATVRYMAQPLANDDDEAALQLLLTELQAAVPAMRSSLERSIERIKRSNAEIDRKLAEMDARR